MVGIIATLIGFRPMLNLDSVLGDLFPIVGGIVCGGPSLRQSLSSLSLPLPLPLPRSSLPEYCLCPDPHHGQCDHACHRVRGGIPSGRAPSRGGPCVTFAVGFPGPKYSLFHHIDETAPNTLARTPWAT